MGTVLYKKPVFYLPLLGVVSPSCFDESILSDLLTYGAQGVMLPYDKNSRWYEKNPELIFPSLFHQDASTMCFVAQRGGVRRLYWYSKSLPSHAERALLLAQYEFDELIHVGNDRPSPSVFAHSTTAFKGDISRQAIDDSILSYDDLPVDERASLKLLAEDDDNSGFSFLSDMLTKGAVVGPVLVQEREKRIIGAIGPLQVQADNRGAVRLLPSYFGVLSRYRREGVGNTLWRQSYAWAYQNGARYTTLESETDSPAERFYLKHGLQPLGYITKVKTQDLANRS